MIVSSGIYLSTPKRFPPIAGGTIRPIRSQRKRGARRRSGVGPHSVGVCRPGRIDAAFGSGKKRYAARRSVPARRLCRNRRHGCGRPALLLPAPATAPASPRAGKARAYAGFVEVGPPRARLPVPFAVVAPGLRCLRAFGGLWPLPVSARARARGRRGSPLPPWPAGAPCRGGPRAAGPGRHRPAGGPWCGCAARGRPGSFCPLSSVAWLLPGGGGAAEPWPIMAARRLPRAARVKGPKMSRLTF